MHATAEEAIEEDRAHAGGLRRLLRERAAMPVVRGVKTDKEKFSGAERTYTIECMMHDKKALQSATSHYFGDGFARAFGITFADKNNTLSTPFQTSWGLSTRIIWRPDHDPRDDNGLVLPPRVAPVQVIVLPIAQHKPGVVEAAEAVTRRLEAAGVRVKMDSSDQSPGWKFAEYEMKGVPLRLEIGPKDIEQGQCVIARRDTGEKTAVSLEELESTVRALLDAVHESMFARAKANLEENTYACATVEEVKERMSNPGRLCQDDVVRRRGLRALHEGALRRPPAAASPFAQEYLGDTCPICGKSAKKMIIWGVAY